MRGGKRPRGGPAPKPRFSKKPKRSKQFWQQRKTVEVAPVPKDDDDSPESSSEEEQEATRTHYDDLLSAFTTGKSILDSIGLLIYGLLYTISPETNYFKN